MANSTSRISPGPASGAAPRASQPLESWKEIAAYLQRDVSTVRRWESSEGLPVHRHRHLARSTIYAYRSELDAWRAHREPVAESTRFQWWRPVPAFASTTALALVLLLAGGGPQIGAVARAADGVTTRQVVENAWATAVSFDGRFLSYIDWDTSDIMLYDLHAGERRNLTSYGSYDASNGQPGLSAWSRDGSQVAYGWWDYSQGHYGRDLRLIDLDGGEPRILIPDDEESWSFLPDDWSPDGRQILARVARPDGSVDLVLVSVADGSVRVLKGTRGTWNWRTRASFSPDGRHVVYSQPSSDGAPSDIFVLSVDGGIDVPLVEHLAGDFALGWVPDGSGVLFASNRSGTWAAWFIRVSEGAPLGAPVMVKPDLPENLFPIGVTQDGSFYYTVNTMPAHLYVTELDPQTGKVLSAPAPIPLRFFGSVVQPAWSPDGRLLAYRFRGPNITGGGTTRDTLLIRDLETGNERQFRLPFWMRNNAGQDWSPDGGSLLMAAEGDDRRQLYQVDTQTGESKIIVEDSPGGVWSPDGSAIYYARQGRLFYRNLGTGREEEVYQGTMGRRRAFSPDRRHLAISEARAIRLVSLAGGESRDLCEAKVPIRSLAWAPDSRHLYFASREGNNSKVWRVSADGGQPKQLLTLTHHVNSLSVHPNGRQIVFDAEEARDSKVWVMENFLPGASAAK